jgi:hypothetical protein
VVTVGFHAAADDLDVSERWLVYPGTETYGLGNGLRATSLVTLMRRLSTL